MYSGYSNTNCISVSIYSSFGVTCNTGVLEGLEKASFGLIPNNAANNAKLTCLENDETN
jgi:hypothetical protein